MIGAEKQDSHHAGGKGTATFRPPGYQPAINNAGQDCPAYGSCRPHILTRQKKMPGRNARQVF